jgi:hypothetical protein
VIWGRVLVPMLRARSTPHVAAHTSEGGLAGWNAVAARRWPGALIVEVADGPFAAVAMCGELPVLVVGVSELDARSAFEYLNVICEDCCARDHALIELQRNGQLRILKVA